MFAYNWETLDGWDTSGWDEQGNDVPIIIPEVKSFPPFRYLTQKINNYLKYREDDRKEMYSSLEYDVLIYKKKGINITTDKVLSLLFKEKELALTFEPVRFFSLVFFNYIERFKSDYTIEEIITPKKLENYDIFLFGIFNNNLEFLIYLVNIGYNIHNVKLINSFKIYDMNVYQYSIFQERIEIMKYLETLGFIANIDAYLFAIKYNKITAMRYLETKFDFDINKCFHHAVLYGHLNIIKYFIKMGANINYINDKGDNALLIAGKNNYIKICKYLIRKGIDINCYNNMGQNILFLLFNCSSELIYDEPSGIHIDDRNSESVSSIFPFVYKFNMEFSPHIPIVKWNENSFFMDSTYINYIEKKGYTKYLKELHKKFIGNYDTYMEWHIYYYWTHNVYYKYKLNIHKKNLFNIFILFI